MIFMMKNLASGRVSPLQNATFVILNGFALAKREGSVQRTPSEKNPSFGHAFKLAVPQCPL